ncbi:MAG: hypothetical protein DI573_04390 [Microbacterium sp.]|uniref:hypothetical protein n=1 Tax=Microbacterium sp. TaxID=51671 RepID=UPI000DB8EA02|nr:hypothetical protein [Microbacterium sp.]PZU40365.1 MAG: hypothetical protein DI573_04390 [Microbacterium sp.]
MLGREAVDAGADAGAGAGADAAPPDSAVRWMLRRTAGETLVMVPSAQSIEIDVSSSSFV